MINWFKKLFGIKDKKSRHVKIYADIPFIEMKCAPYDYSTLKINKDSSEKQDKAFSDS